MKEILEYIVEDDEKHERTSEREKYWIEKENTIVPNGYNISPGGEGGITPEIAQRSANTRKARGYSHSDETKKKISEKRRGMKFSDDHKQHLSENHRQKTVHRIVHEDGTIEETTNSVSSIAKRYGTSANTLRRYSAKKEFVNGIYLDGVDRDKYECCTYKHGKEDGKKLCIDPILGDVCTLYAQKNRKSRDKEKYHDVIPRHCIIGECVNENRSDYPVIAGL